MQASMAASSASVDSHHACTMQDGYTLDALRELQGKAPPGRKTANGILKLCRQKLSCRIPGSGLDVFAETSFNWKGYLSNHPEAVEICRSPVTGFFAYKFPEKDPSRPDVGLRVDFVVTRLDGTAVRLHPHKGGTVKEAKIVVGNLDDWCSGRTPVHVIDHVAVQAQAALVVPPPPTRPPTKPETTPLPAVPPQPSPVHSNITKASSNTPENVPEYPAITKASFNAAEYGCEYLSSKRDAQVIVDAASFDGGWVRGCLVASGSEGWFPFDHVERLERLDEQRGLVLWKNLTTAV